MRILFIDDERNPTATHPDRDELVVARTPDEAKDALLTDGPWDEVWFDHDMGWDKVKYFKLMRANPNIVTEELEAQAFVTTRPLAKWLIAHKDAVTINGCILVHTSNPVGADWLMEVLKEYGVPVYRETVAP